MVESVLEYFGTVFAHAPEEEVQWGIELLALVFAAFKTRSASHKSLAKGQQAR